MAIDIKDSWELLADNGEIRGPLSTADVFREIKKGGIGAFSLLRPLGVQTEQWSACSEFSVFDTCFSEGDLSQDDYVKSEMVTALIHDQKKLYECSLGEANESNFNINLSSKDHNFSMLDEIYVHLYSFTQGLSVNVWGVVSEVKDDIIVLKLGNLSVPAKNKYLELLTQIEVLRAA